MITINNVQDVIKICAKVGLEPVNLEPEAVPIVIQYLNDIGLDFGARSVVPMGYDWGCEKGKDKCTKQF